MKKVILKEEHQRFKATGTLPPIDPLAMVAPESPRVRRYFKAPPTPDSPFATRTPMMFDK